MTHTVSQLKDSVSGMLSGIDLGNVDNLNGALERAARILVQKADVPEASGIQNISLYSGVYDYPCDPKIFGTAINDVRPAGGYRNYNNFATKRMGETFDRTKQFVSQATQTAFEYVNGTPIIRISTGLTPQQTIISTMSSTTDWTASGSASGLTEDQSMYYVPPASLRFTLTGSSTGILTNTLQTPIDLSAFQGVGVCFLALMIPQGSTASNLTNIVVRLGSSDTAYVSMTETEGFLGSWVSGEWLLVAFDLASVTTVGSPAFTAIDYLQVRFAHTATFTNMRIGGFFVSLPVPVQILYQSAAIFLPVGSTTALTTITSDTDTIILNDPAYTILELESALSIVRQTGGAAADPTVIDLTRQLHGNGSDLGLYNHYRGDNPSQELRTTGNWYTGYPDGWSYFGPPAR